LIISKKILIIITDTLKVSGSTPKIESQNLNLRVDTESFVSTLKV